MQGGASVFGKGWQNASMRRQLGKEVSPRGHFVSTKKKVVAKAKLS